MRFQAAPEKQTKNVEAARKWANFDVKQNYMLVKIREITGEIQITFPALHNPAIRIF